MGVDGPSGDEQAVASMQRDRRLAVFLPNAGAGQDVEGDCRRMQMSRIDCAGSVLRVPNDHFLPRCVRQFAFQERRMGNAGPFLADHGLGLQRAHARKRRDAEYVGKKSAGQNAPLGWLRASIARPDILAGLQMEAALNAG